MHERLKSLLSPPFIFCLVLLILNDFFFKVAFHNSLTGKLSDLCGLFIFPIFWSAVFPKRRLWVFIFTGILFVFWKSEYSSGLIELISTVFMIQRTVDTSDLIVLPVLLLAWFHNKGVPNLVVGNSFVSRLSALFIAVVTIFSFCATSQQRSVQSFDQPQYVLLRSEIVPSASLYDEFEFYQKDSLIVVKINYLYINRPVRDDDYNKNRSLKDLDADVLARISDSLSLVPNGKITILSVNTPQGLDALRFDGGRLDGRFTRTNNGKMLIEGFYKKGIEDSTWILRDTNGNSFTKLTFVNGERTKVEQFDQGKLISSKSINTRADTITTIYIQIGTLILIMLGIIFILLKHIRTVKELKLKTIWKWLLGLISPIFIWLSHIAFKILLMDYHYDIFETLATIVFIFMITCPLMFVVIFWIKLRKEIDIVLYCLMFGLACTIWTTFGTLIALNG